PHTVVGVLPPGFRYPGAPGHENILVPLRLRADPSDTGHNYNVLARISSGVSPERVRADMAAVYSRFAQEHPELTVEGERAMGFMSFQDLYVGGMQRTLWVLMGTVGLVLLIACANVANLLLARATSRRREIATRVALGATRGRIVSQLLTESLVLALIAGVAGLLLSIWSLHLMLALLPEVLPRMEDIGVDVRVLAFTLAVAFMTGLAFGLAAALPASRTELITSIKEGTPGGGSHGGRRAQSVLVAAEVALSLILLAGANLLIASFLKVTAVETGFNARDVLTVNLGRAPEGYDSGARLAELERRLVERLRDVPGITSVAAASNLPLQRGWNISMELDGRPGEGESAIEWRAVSPEYFAALEIPVVRGRGFTTFDGESSASVAIINEATARHYWPNSDPIGQRLWVSRSDGRPAAEIVGVVGDIREIRLGLPPRRTVYVPQAQTPPSMMGGLPRLMIRTTRRAAAVEAVKEALPEIDPRLREPTVLSMDDVVAASIANERFNMLFIGSFAGVALLLTMVGIFGVVSYAVRQRVREIAIRMALGAAGPSVGRMVVRQGMRAVMLGLAIGLLGAFALTRVIAGMLYGVTPTDPVSFASALVLLVGVALAAGYIPARRATHVDPMITLRAE
ncbi:MAG: ABC transporter permease, partial [Longimicrobiales bacterium]